MLRPIILLVLMGAPALTYALDDCSAQLAAIDKQLDSTNEPAVNVMAAMQIRQTIDQMCFMLDDGAMSKMLKSIDQALKTDLENSLAAAPPEPQPDTSATGRSLGARFIDRPEEMGFFLMWDMDVFRGNARMLYTSGPYLQQLGLPDWQQYVYVVEMTPDGTAKQTMVTSKQAQDFDALALRRGHDEIHFERRGPKSGDPSTLELWSISRRERLSSAITPTPVWPDGEKWDWQPFRMATSDGNVLFNSTKTNAPDDRSLIAWFEAKPNGQIAGQGSTVRTDEAGAVSWVETTNGGAGLLVRLMANDMNGIETRLRTPIRRKYAGRDIHAIVFSETRLLVTSNDARSFRESDALSRKLAWDGDLAPAQGLPPMESSRQTFEQMEMTQAVERDVGAAHTIESVSGGPRQDKMIRPTSDGYVALMNVGANRKLDPPVHGPYLMFFDENEINRKVYLNPMAEALNVDLKLLAVSPSDDIYVFGTTLGRGIDAFVIKVVKDGGAEAYTTATKNGHNHFEAMIADDSGVWLFGQGTMKGRVAPRIFVERIEL
jgi:hypothetical protein